MNSKEIGELKKLLKDKQDELLKTMKNKKQVDLRESDVGDEVDTAGDSEERELLFGLTDNEKNMFDSIGSAIKKIEVGKYGLCESCSAKIPFERLKAMPYARYCIKCQPKFEKKPK
jgi:DnaK suppressor protein